MISLSNTRRISMASTRCCVLSVLVLAFLWSSAAAAAPARRDHGALIALEVAGSYAEMGRQQAELLGEDLRRVYELQRREFDEGVATAGFGGWWMDRLGVPLWSWLGAAFEDSSFHEELGGLAEGLGVPRREVMRALLALGGGSTVFAATRSATVDGEALIGRNVDWDDQLGARRPVVIHYRPDNGDLEYLAAGWPLVGLPTVGVNAAGFALSFNFFETDPQVGVRLPQWPHRRALQRARTVAEGIELFTEARQLGIACFMVMADALGDIAMVECTPSECAVFRPEDDWFGQANHARTPEMIPFDLYRSPDSFDRRVGVESAVDRFVGSLTPTNAVEILRDRSRHPWPNASNVANLTVLNAAVVHPASRTLWHAQSMQPVAPFGAYIGFSLDAEGPRPATIDASSWFGSAAMTREVAVVGQARRGLHDLMEGRYAAARDRFDAVGGFSRAVLDPRRIALGAAAATLLGGDPAGALLRLEAALEEEAPVDVRIYALALAGQAHDALGERSAATKRFRQVIAAVEAQPQWNVFARVAEVARAGMAESTAPPVEILPYDSLRVPR